jgi:hypothetical protein
MERKQATLDGDDGKLLQAGEAAKSDHNYQEREGAKALPRPPLHSTSQPNAAQCADSLKMNDISRDQEKNEDSSSQSASE